MAPQSPNGQAYSDTPPAISLPPQWTAPLEQNNLDFMFHARPTGKPHQPLTIMALILRPQDSFLNCYRGKPIFPDDAEYLLS
jgi:hypothetical protein